MRTPPHATRRYFTYCYENSVHPSVRNVHCSNFSFESVSIVCSLQYDKLKSTKSDKIMLRLNFNYTHTWDWNGLYNLAEPYSDGI